MVDLFRPHTQLAAAIYDAFQREAAKRKSRAYWIEKERETVYLAACHNARQLGVREPTMDEVKQAEDASIGSADYGSKWAIKIANICCGESVQKFS